MPSRLTCPAVAYENRQEDGVLLGYRIGSSVRGDLRREEEGDGGWEDDGEGKGELT